MLSDTAQILQEINALKYRGATLTELWNYILKSPHRQKVWMNHYTGATNIFVVSFIKLLKKFKKIALLKRKES